MQAEAWRFGVVLAMLAGATLSDLRTRRVRDPYWIPFAAAAAGFAAWDAVAEGLRAAAVPFGLAAVACAFLYGLWRLNLFGGADAKGLMVVAFLWPLPLARSAGHATLPVLDLLVNASLLSLAVPLAFGAWNLAHGRWAGLATFLGVPMPVEAARSRHVWPLQRARPDGGLRWKHWQRRGEDLEAAYDGLAAAGVATVWVTPKVPYFVPLTAGAAVAGLWGNLPLRPLLALLA